MVLGTSSFFYFFQMLNNWPRVLMFIWDNSYGFSVDHIAIQVHPVSSTLDLHNNRLINSPTDFEKYYGLVAISVCNRSLPENVTYHWQQYFEGVKLHDFQTSTCYASIHCIKDGTYVVSLSVTTSQGELLSVGSRSLESRPQWVAILGDSFASGEGNPEIRRSGYAKAQWIDDRCHRSGKSFAAHVYWELQKVRPHSHLTFLACAGATVENGILESNGSNSQIATLESIATMRGRGPDMVILTTGGNDIGFSDIINSLLHESYRIDISLMDMRFFFVSHQLDTVAERLKSLGAGSIFIPQYFDFTKNQYGEVDSSCIGSGEEDFGEINRVISKPRSTIKEYNGAIVVTVGWWSNRLFEGIRKRFKNLIEKTGSVRIKYQRSSSNMTFAEWGILRRLNLLLLKKGVEHGWHVATTVPALFARRGICSSQSYIRTREESIALQGDAMGAFHPNQEGHRVVAEEILKLVRRSGVTCS